MIKTIEKVENERMSARIFPVFLLQKLQRELKAKLMEVVKIRPIVLD